MSQLDRSRPATYAVLGLPQIDTGLSASGCGPGNQTSPLPQFLGGSGVRSTSRGSRLVREGYLTVGIPRVEGRTGAGYQVGPLYDRR